ncbi:27567_t:CDS:2, partial [Dentiscutata erythropus]
MCKKRESETAKERERHLKRECESRRQKRTKRQLKNNNAQNQDTNSLHIESPSINKLANKLCSICKEYFPLIELIGIRKECHHCYYDTKNIIKNSQKKTIWIQDVSEFTTRLPWYLSSVNILVVHRLSANSIEFKILMFVIL